MVWKVSVFGVVCVSDVIGGPKTQTLLNAFKRDEERLERMRRKKGERRLYGKSGSVPDSHC
jgi:hypothetical protein